MGPCLEKGCNPRHCAWLGAGDSAVSKPDLSTAQEHPVRGQMDWRQRGEGLEKWELDPVLGCQHHTRPSPEGLWAGRRPRRASSLCALRVFLRACVPMFRGQVVPLIT